MILASGNILSARSIKYEFHIQERISFIVE